MSLTTDIATLTARYEALAAIFDGKEASIEARVAAALTALPAATRTVYIDAINGDDANNGLTVAAPVQTLARAMELGANYPNLDIYLMTDVTLTRARYALGIGQRLAISAYLGAEGANRKKLILTTQPPTGDGASGDWEVSGFYAPRMGLNTVNCNSLEIVFPSAPAAGTMVSDSYNGLLAANIHSGPALTGLEINFCSIIRPAGSVGVMAGIRTHFLGLFVKTSTYVTADMAGKWVANVAAGATPASIGWVASNLSTL